MTSGERDWDTLKKRFDVDPYKDQVRVVSPKMYDVIKSMVKDGLISGRPYSEYENIEEFEKRMREYDER